VRQVDLAFGLGATQQQVHQRIVRQVQQTGQRIDFLVLPQPAVAAKEYAWVPPAVGAVAARLEHEAGVVRIDDRDYYLLDLSACPRD